MTDIEGADFFSPDKQAFFEALDTQQLAVTFGDVYLRTHQSSVPASEVNLDSKFSRNVELHTPIVSAAMDTVTTAEMAIAMACLGGIGVIHAGLGIEDQKRAVRRVKLFMNGKISDPVSYSVDNTIESILEDCRNRGLDFRSFPVLGTDRKLAGLLTEDSFKFTEDMSVLASERMMPIANILTAPKGTDIHTAYELMVKNEVNTLPLVDDNFVLRGLYKFSDVSRIVRGNAQQFNTDSKGRLRVAAAIPTDEYAALERIGEMAKYLDVVVIDSAQGDSHYAFNTLKLVKESYEDLDVNVGNVSEADSARLLVEAGADGVKIGQGPGSICSTRTETGIGAPQITAIYECTKAVTDIDPDVPVCADGGIQEPQDIAKAIAAGASSVMLGNMLAGTAEAPGEIKYAEDGTQYKPYRGQGSLEALRDSAAARKRYGQDGGAMLLPEGVSGKVPYRGSVEQVVLHLSAALRRSLAYYGAATIEESRRNARLKRQTAAGLREGYPRVSNPFALSETPAS